MVGGRYVLVDAGPGEQWHYEYIASGPLTPTEFLPIGTIAEIHEPSKTRARDIERLLRIDPGALIVAEVDGEIVGSVIVGWGRVAVSSRSLGGPQ